MSVMDGMTHDPDDDEFAYTDADGMSWSGLEEVLAIKVFGFCMCGAPDLALRLMRDALRLADMQSPSDYDAHRAWYHAIYRPACEAVFGDKPGVEEVVWYLLNDKGLLEHGSSVPGWLTDKGRELLADLETLFAEEAA